MTSRVSFLAALRAAKWDHWREALVLMGYTLLGGLAPLWIGWIVLALTHGHPQVIDFASHGEFALYTAALLAPAIYLIVHERSETPFTNQALFVLLALAGILVSVAAYGLVAPETSKVMTFSNLDRASLADLSVDLFLGSVVYALLVSTLDNVRTTPPVRDIVAQQQRDLEADFDRLPK